MSYHETTPDNQSSLGPEQLPFMLATAAMTQCIIDEYNTLRHRCQIVPLVWEMLALPFFDRIWFFGYNVGSLLARPSH